MSDVSELSVSLSTDAKAASMGVGGEPTGVGGESEGSTV